MTEKYEIEDIEDMFRVLKDGEPLTTKFENTDRMDITNLVEELNELCDENEKLNELLNLITKAYSVTKDESVKEILRDEIRGIDTVTDIYASAWNDYCILSKFFKERYGEHWDND